MFAGEQNGVNEIAIKIKGIIIPILFRYLMLDFLFISKKENWCFEIQLVGKLN